MRSRTLGCVLAAAMMASSCDTVGRAVVGGPGPGIIADDVANDAIDAVDTANIVTSCDAGQRVVNNICVGDGALNFTLTWDHPGDLDLHVITPAGHEIYFPMANRMFDGGVLDRDDTSGTGPENVFWNGVPPVGHYIVCVLPFAITTATNFVVDVRLDGAMVREWTGSRVASSNETCSATSQYFVGAFDVM